MRLHGMCTGCHRVRRVSVSGSALAVAGARGSSVPEGICDDCEQKEEARRTGIVPVRERQRIVHGWSFRHDLSDDDQEAIRRFLESGRASELPASYLRLARGLGWAS